MSRQRKEQIVFYASDQQSLYIHINIPMTHFHNKTTLLSTEDSFFIETSTLAVDVLYLKFMFKFNNLSITLVKASTVLVTEYLFFF